jgi:hypothetical protein
MEPAKECQERRASKDNCLEGAGMKKGVLSAFIILMLVVGFGCGNDDNGANPKPSKIVVTLQPEALTQGVGLVDTFTATVTGGTNHALSWSVNDVPGGDSATVGSISTAGRYRAPDDVPLPATVTVKATSVEDPSVSDTAQVTIVSGNGTGLPADYSTGPQLLEGPIFHGYWSSCTGTNHNWYQGECTPVALSPVDWAWGLGWTVSWTGQLFIPVSGDYRFSSHYWVDGIVHIEIDGTVVADMNTTGAGYSLTLPLQGNTWIPVSMTFEPNGGSNNMHLGWVSPGGEWCPVARSYLKP